MAVRSREFWAVNPALNTNRVDLYTVPSNRVAIVRTWTISNAGAGAAIAIAVVDIGGGSRRVWAGSIAPGTTIPVPVPIILSEGHVFGIITPVTNQLATFGCGSLLDGDPS